MNLRIHLGQKRCGRVGKPRNGQPSEV